METERLFATRKSAWRAFLRAADTTPGDRFGVGIAASFTAEPLVPFIGGALLDRGFVPQLAVAPYGQLHQACANPEESFQLPQLRAICLLWRIEDLFPRALRNWMQGNRAATEDFEAELQHLALATKALADRTGAIVVTTAPSFPQLPESSPHSLVDLPLTSGFFSQVRSRWDEYTSELRNVCVVDMEALVRQIGSRSAYDPRRMYLYRQPWSDEFLYELGERAGRLISASVAPARKCIAVDCDNTIWGGIVGEDGLEGIQLGDEFPGSAFADLQRLLLHWKSQGVMLALLSKNNEAEVWEVFDRHDGMVLKRQDIAAARINWAPKPDNLQSLAQELNIGLDAFVFLDDSPTEIHAMRTSLPEVESVLLPEDPARIVAALQEANLFETLRVSEEDRIKTELIARESSRSRLRESLTREEYIESLGLSLDVFTPNQSHVSRVAQLINKTNQFNLTTKRRTENEVRQLLSSSSHRVLAARIFDKFGDYGLTALAVFEKHDSETWGVDTFLMSCRVLGRDVEFAFMAACVNALREAGATIVHGRYIPTERNQVVASFLANAGFAAASGDSWILDTAATRPLASIRVGYVD